MKPLKGNWTDDETERIGKRSKKSKRPLNEDDENEFQSWMNRPSDVSDYLDDEEDFHSQTRRT
jgi:hypothetical protein